MSGRIPLDREQATIAVLVVGFLVVSAVAGPLLIGGWGAHPSSASGGSTATATPTPARGHVSTPQPRGSMAAIPASHTSTPPSASPPNVSASAGAQTMRVAVVSKHGQPALQLSDSHVHRGRWVAVPTSWIRSTFGRVPQTVSITHSGSGSPSTYAAQLHVKGSSAAFYVRQFTTNTVTFSGRVSISATPATNGSQFSYNLASGSSASNFGINVTGHTSSDWDNQSASGVGVNSTQSLTVGGNTAPTNGSGGDPTLSVTAHAVTDSYNPAISNTGSTGTSTQQFVGDTGLDNTRLAEARVEPSHSFNISQITVDIAGTVGSNYNPSVTIYIKQGTPDGTYNSGTKVKANWYPSWSIGNQTVTLDTPYYVTAGANYTVEFVTGSTNSDGSGDYLKLNTASGAAFGAWYRRGQNFRDGGTINDSSTKTNDYPSIWVSTGPRSVENLSVSDGAGHTATFGNLSNGQTKTQSLNLSTSSSSLSWSGSGGGSIDYHLTMREYSQTVDPLVTVNGHTTSYSGTLADGTTKSLTANSSWIQTGQNNVTINVGNGTLPAGSPAPSVDLDYRHDASKTQSTTYKGQMWSERYNVSTSYASQRHNASVTIPFQGTVMSVRSAKYRFNGTSWQSFNSADYALNGTTFRGNLSAAYGGPLPAGTTVDVKVVGSKVRAYNASITVTQASDLNASLATRFNINTWHSDSYLGVTNDGVGSRLHYLNATTWDDSASYAKLDSQGRQRLYLPGASGGESATAKTLPLSFSVKTNEIRVHVPDGKANSTEPVYHVAPGAHLNDGYSVAFLDAKSGTTYQLYSETNGVVRDSGAATASDPLVSGGDLAETLRIQPMASTGSASSGGGGGGAAGILGPARNPTGNPLALLTRGQLIGLLVVFGALAALVLVSRGNDRIDNAGSSAAAKTQSALDGVPIVGPAVGGAVGGAIRASSQTVTAALENKTVAFAVGAAIVGAALQAGIIQLPTRLTILLVIGAVAVGTYLGLRRYDHFSWLAWGGIQVVSIGATVFVLAKDPLQTLTQSQAFPLLVVAGAGLIWYFRRQIKARLRPNNGTPQNVTIKLDQGDGGD